MRAAFLLLMVISTAVLVLSGQVQDRDLIIRPPLPDALKTPISVPRGFAIVIGISSYKNLPKDSWLSFAEKDAENLFATLIDKDAGNFEFENVRKLEGSAATLSNIRNALEEWLPDKAQETDRTVVFFVGHGFVDGAGRGYLAPYDIDPNRLADTAYPMERLGEVLSRRVRSHLKVLLVDACHSGNVAPGSSPLSVNESLRGLPQAFLTLASSRAAERSYEDPDLGGGNGVFTYFLTQGWKGEADTEPADGVVTADELISYVKREVRLYVRAKGRQQTPVEFGYFPDELILGYSQLRRAHMAASLPELAGGTIIVETNLNDVEIDVDDKRRGTAGNEQPLKIPGLTAGPHTVRGSRMGYEPVSVQINVAPGGLQRVPLWFLRQRIINPQAKAFYDDGEKIWRTSNASPSNLKKAAVLFSRALSEDPSFGEAALGLCRVQQSQGATDQALKSCRSAVAKDPDSVDARATYAILLMETGDYPEAVRQLQSAALQTPKSSFVQSLLAEALYLADRPEEAEAAVERAVVLDPSSAQAFLLRAEARRAQGKFEDAADDYRRSLKLQEFDSNPLRVAAYWAIGTGIRKHHSGRRAIYRSQSASANFGLCACENGRGNYQRAVPYCNRALSEDRSDPDTYVLLSESYTGLFNHDNRREYLVHTKTNIEAALRLNPNMDRATELRRKLSDIAEIIDSVR